MASRAGLLTAAITLVLVVTACGGEATETPEDATADTAAAADGQGITVSTRDTSLGTILVSDGMTLYLFEADTGDESTCYDACAKAWPPLTIEGDAEAGEGAEAGRLGTTERDEGSTQVTYAGHPLYFFAHDSAPGDTNGNDVDGFGGLWYAVTPAGTSVEDEETSPDSGY